MEATRSTATTTEIEIEIATGIETVVRAETVIETGIATAAVGGEMIVETVTAVLRMATVAVRRMFTPVAAMPAVRSRRFTESKANRLTRVLAS